MTSPGTGAPAPMPARRFHVRQKITPLQNTYRIFADAAGEPGELVGYAKQKRFAFKESFTVFADERASQPVMTIQADRRIDIRSAMTVTDAVNGQVVGRLRKRGRASLVRSTWELEQPRMPVVVVRERSVAVALLRRIWDLIPYASSIPVPWVFHFDGATEDGVPVLAHSRLWGIRDRYVLDLHSPALDPRLAIALAICLDAMQKR